ncbi:MAG TPA: hypothetical protein VGK44_01350 [Casimicrobiaceae bacterium]|jgi:hypothetical protein
MNRGSLKIAPGADLGALLVALAQLGPKLMFELAPKLMSLSTATTRNFVDTATELVTSTLPKIEIPNLQEGCCEIPETQCPPRCVCDIHWIACQGGSVQASIRVVNTGTATRTFAFSATPLSGPGNPAAKIQVTPSSAVLAPNAFVEVAVSLAITPDLKAGQYLAEVLILGAYEQCVRVTLDVECGSAVVDCRPRCCEVKAGDLPVRIRAHHWYDHFQCTEPCTELLQRSPDSNPHQ